MDRAENVVAGLYTHLTDVVRRDVIHRAEDPFAVDEHLEDPAVDLQRNPVPPTRLCSKGGRDTQRRRYVVIAVVRTKLPILMPV